MALNGHPRLSAILSQQVGKRTWRWTKIDANDPRRTSATRRCSSVWLGCGAGVQNAEKLWAYSRRVIPMPDRERLSVFARC
jgi:hypothetical protein